MDKDQVRQKLNNFMESFELEAGNFKSFLVIHNYVSFIKLESYIKQRMNSIISYAEAQMGLMAEEIRNDKQTEIGLEQIPNLGVFPDEIETMKQVSTGKTDKLGWDKALAINYTTLLAVYILMEKIQEAKGEEKDNLIKIAKEEAFAFFTIKNPADGKDMVINNSTYLGMSMALINKYLVDLIDSENLVSNNQTANSISFDKDNSVLNIYGQAIKISLKNDKPTDHFILEAIFANPDKTEETYFKDIAQDYINVEEYDSSKDWNRFRNACDRLNQKVDNSTNGQIKDFIERHTGKTGWCKINPKYL